MPPQLPVRHLHRELREGAGGPAALGKDVLALGIPHRQQRRVHEPAVRVLDAGRRAQAPNRPAVNPILEWTLLQI